LVVIQTALIILTITISQILTIGPFSKIPLDQLSLISIISLTFIGMGLSLSKLLQSHHHQVESLQSLASTDALTKLVNRGQFNHRIQAEISRAKRHHSPLSLALFDIDNFKHLNDFYGHPVGDRILKELGALIAENVRESDIAARYGGEEFALVLPETAEKEATDLLERLRQMIAETVFCLPDNPITLTVSIGVAELAYRQRQANALELIERADQALYQAKAQGKNKVYVSSQILAPTIARYSSRH
jgi:diguanylate cyclase (GGDEF)-like protein